MRFQYGRQDFNTLERGEENCYLLTNGLGGFASSTLVGSVSRNDHAILMACTVAPNHRYNILHRLSERLWVGERQYPVSSQKFADGTGERGYENLVSFSFEDCPVWRYQAAGVEIVKTVAMAPKKNTVALTYEIHNHGRESCLLAVTPFFQFVRKGEDLKRDQPIQLLEGKIVSGDLTLHFTTNGKLEQLAPCYEEYAYDYDKRDGRRETGTAYADHRLCLQVAGGGKNRLEVVYSMDEEAENAAAILAEMTAFRREAEVTAGFTSPVARLLSKSAAQFICDRESTGGETILAGYPFFEDWGRDTMIALPGCALATGRFSQAKSILRTFMSHLREGLMPNLFPEGSREPAYNTVDASLLFINCVYLYFRRTKDMEFLAEAYPVMEDIIRWYRKGTRYGIREDSDGLLMAGEKFDQVTWMDVRVGELLPTPRHGKPVEVNAYWYNALCIMEVFSTRLDRSCDYGEAARRTRQSFREQFWMEEEHCLKDVLCGTRAETQIRCNQIWAVSLPFTMLSGVQEKLVVQTVFEKLYTPYGLRSLAPEDEEFHPHYGGSLLERDLAYHQGTVWVFPLGAYYMAYLRVHDYSREAVETVTRQLEVMECALREGCVGQLPEIYDGGNPTASRGCFAQAWSLGEILRVYEVLEGHEKWSEDYGKRTDTDFG